MSDSNTRSGETQFLSRALEATIRIGLLFVLAAWCFQITRPFIIPLVWGIVIATALYPVHTRLAAAIGDRSSLAAALITLAALAILIVPAVFLAGSLVESGQWLAAGLQEGSLEVPPAPERIAAWPVIGEPLYEFWNLANVNFEAAIRRIGPHLLTVGGGMLSAAAGVGLGILQFTVSILIAGILLTRVAGSYEVAQAIASRVAGERGPEFANLAGALVRSVATGILGVAIIQSGLIAIGLFAVGVPHASLWTALCLLLAVVQLPPALVVLPIIFWVFSAESTLTSVLFTAWSIVAMGCDSVLKPLLLSRGLDLPMVVIFIGAIGGFMTSGFIGLFVGAIVLALGYELFMAWLRDPTESQDPAEPQPVAAADG